jgi:hypothetical protein
MTGARPLDEGGTGDLGGVDPAATSIRISPVAIGVVGAGLALLFFLAWLWPMVGGPVRTEPYPRELRPFTSLYDPASRPLEVVMNGGDGQAFAAIGRDPLLREPDVFWLGPEDAAYRYQRPLFGWLAWATAGGRPQLVPEALAAWSVIGIGLMIGAVAWALERAGRLPWTALLLIAAPGVLSNLRTTGPEALGCGLAVLGVIRWRDHRWQAVACFTLAALCRETLLLVPAVLALHGLIEQRRLRPFLPLLVSPALFAGWVVVVNVRTGAWPTQASTGRLAPGFRGVVEATYALGTGDYVVIALSAVVAAAVVWRARYELVGWMVLAHLGLASVLGERVWRSWHDFGRVLLPMAVFGLIALAPRRPHLQDPDLTQQAADAEGGSGGGPVAVEGPPAVASTPGSSTGSVLQPR